MSSKLKSSTVSCDFIELLDPTRDRLEVKSPMVSDQAPAGFVGAFAKSSPPSGWLKCNGAAISRASYADLFAEIGTIFGTGDGSTTFNVPDMRGEFARGWIDDKTLAGETGRTIGSFQGDAIRNLTGHFGIFMHRHGYWQGGVFTRHSYGTNVHGNGSDYASGYIHIDASLLVPTADDNRPRNIALLYCIKY